MGYLSDRPESHTNVYLRFDERLSQLRSFYTLAKPLFDRAKIRTADTHEFQRKTGLDRIAKGEKNGKPYIKRLDPELVSLVDEYKRKHVASYDDFFNVYPTLVVIFSHSIFEFYISDIVRNIYSLNIDYLKSQKQLPIEDIISNSSDITSLHNYLIEQECEKIRGSYTDIIGYIDKRFKLLTDDINRMKIDMIEISEIRNILVHNDGIVNELFLKNIKNDKYRLGEKIIIDKELMDKTVNLYHNLMTLIDREVMKKFFNNETK